MNRLYRPYIPIAVRVQVAERQVGFPPCPEATPSSRLEGLLLMLFGDEPADLDHDPPLGAREKIWKDGKVVGYIPDANDPDHLVYRAHATHLIKTNVRGLRGQHPDRVLIKKQRRLERPSKPKRKREWPRGRKISNRGFSSLRKLRGLGLQSRIAARYSQTRGGETPPFFFSASLLPKPTSWHSRLLGF